MTHKKKEASKHMPGRNTTTERNTLPLWAAKALRDYESAVDRAGDEGEVLRAQRRGYLLDKLQTCAGVSLDDLLQRGAWQPNRHKTEDLWLDGYAFGLFTDWDGTYVGLLGICNCGAECIALFSKPAELGAIIKAWRLGLGACCAEHQPDSVERQGMQIRTIK